jgi:hypothetical protein
MRLPLMTTARWMVLIAVCAVCLGVWLAYHRWVAMRLDQIFLEARKRAGLPLDARMADFGIPLPGYLMFCVQLDHLLMKFWFVLLPLIVLLSLGVALSIPPTHADSRPASTASERPERDDRSPSP